MLSWVRVLAVAAAGAVLASCSADGPAPQTPVRTSNSWASPRSSTATAAPAVSKVLVLVVENHSLNQMREGMPWTYALAEQYGHATAFKAITHPSEPNYLAMAAGSTFGVHDDLDPAVNEVTGRSVFGQARASGQTATIYAEGMPEPCALTDGGDRYAVRHNPWTYFADERAACRSHDVPLTELAADTASGDLPDVGMVIPDVCHDGHDCDLGTTDGWMRRVVGGLLNGPDFAAGRLAVVITADEDDYSQDNTVLTVVAHPSLDHVVVDSPLDHYSIAGLFSDVLGQSRLRKARTAPSMVEAFGLPLG